MNMLSIASGSKGNASLIYNEETLILVDFGISRKRVNDALESLNRSFKNIDFFLFTHDHVDHIKNEYMADVNRKYARAGTINLLKENILDLGKTYHFNTIDVIPILTSHDAISPCGFIFKDESTKLVYLTDTGIIPKSTLKKIINADVYFIESNHDIDMLINSERPITLIKRILSNKGHLSNLDCAKYLVNIVGDKTKRIVFAHLSEECNKEELVLKTFKNVFDDFGVDYSNINIECASQRKVIKVW